MAFGQFYCKYFKFHTGFVAPVKMKKAYYSLYLSSLQLEKMSLDYWRVWDQVSAGLPRREMKIEERARGWQFILTIFFSDFSLLKLRVGRILKWYSRSNRNKIKTSYPLALRMKVGRSSSIGEWGTICVFLLPRSIGNLRELTFFMTRGTRRRGLLCSNV